MRFSSDARLLLALFLATCAVPGAAETPEPPMPNPERGDREKPTAEKSDHPAERSTVAWSAGEVGAAKAKCAELLAEIELNYEPLPPIKEGLCGAPAPIKVTSIGRDPPVVISPPAIMRCAVAATLYGWFKERVQPAAKSTLGSPVIRVRNAASYACRTRYGADNARLSEHALANALDISEFVFASGKHITVLKSWRHVVAAIELPPPMPRLNPHRLEAAQAATQQEMPATTGAIVSVSVMRSVGNATLDVAKIKANPFVRPTAAPATRFPRSELPQTFSRLRPGASAKIETAAATSNPFVVTAKTNPFVSLIPDLQYSTRLAPKPAPLEPAKPDEARKSEEKAGETSPAPKSAEPLPAADAAFVRTVHDQACKVFGTVLGPAANEAHKDHFHLDMKTRRHAGYCQ